MVLSMTLVAILDLDRMVPESISKMRLKAGVDFEFFVTIYSTKLLLFYWVKLRC